MDRIPYGTPPRWWSPLLRPRFIRRFRAFRVGRIRRVDRLVDVEVRGLEVLRDLLARGHGVMIASTGFDQLKALLAGKGAQVLLILTTNRLARKLYKALQFVEEEVVGRGIRCIFVKSGIDTADEKRWRLMLNHVASVDELVTSMYAENIRVAQEGLFRLNLVCGTITLGYLGKEVAGIPTRQKKPRREYQVDPDTAPWVARIFAWYVRDGLTIAEIVRRLNDDPNAPVGPKALSGRWTRLAVKLVLANPRYRGLWAYGKTQAVWQVKGDYVRQVERHQPLAQQQVEELRIVDDATWYAASARLASEQHRNAGRKPRDGGRKSRPRLLNGILVCAAHCQRLYAAGAHGKVMVCPHCQGMPAEQRPLYTQLNRQLALRLTCAKLAELVQADPALVEAVIAAFRREMEAQQQPDAAALIAAKAKVDRISRRIQFLIQNVGSTDHDQAESASFLRKLRSERAEAEAEKAALEASLDRPTVVPTAEQVAEALISLRDILVAASSEDAAESLGVARHIIEALTGGQISLEQQGERKAQRGWLRGRFRVSLLDVIMTKVAGVQGIGTGPEIEVTIDYRKSSAADDWADRVKELYDRGLLIKAIANELSISRSLARKALEAAHRARGLAPPPDGRSRRSELDMKHLEAPLYQRVADEIKELMDNGELLDEIASAMDVDRNTVTAAKDWWYQSRGLQPPDGRKRRKELVRKSRRLIQ